MSIASKIFLRILHFQTNFLNKERYKFSFGKKFEYNSNLLFLLLILVYNTYRMTSSSSQKKIAIVGSGNWGSAM